VTNLFVTGARDRENARDQVAPTSHVTVGTHVTYHVDLWPSRISCDLPHNSSRDPASLD